MFIVTEYAALSLLFETGQPFWICIHSTDVSLDWTPSMGTDNNKVAGYELEYQKVNGVKRSQVSVNDPSQTVAVDGGINQTAKTITYSQELCTNIYKTQFMCVLSLLERLVHRYKFKKTTLPTFLPLLFKIEVCCNYGHKCTPIV